MIGQSIERIDGKILVTGKANYLADINLPNMVHGKFYRSPYAHAKIKSIDILKAKSLPGVIGIYTGKDMAELTNPYGQAGILDEFVVATDKVRFQGDEVLVIVAETEAQAEDAMELIKIEWDVLPVVLDPEEAIKNDAPVIHENLEGIVGGNICTQHKVRAGDIEQGFAEADFVFKERFVTSKASATPMETHQSLAIYEPEDETLTLWTTTQNAHVARFLLAHALSMSESRITVKVPYVGGGFGHKCDIFANDIASAALAVKLKRPVRIVLDRRETFQAGRSRHPQIRNVEIGVKKDGRIVAWKEKIIQDSGAYSSLGPGVLKLSCGVTIGPYKIPNMWIDGYLVYTNKQPSGAYRGFGNPQATFTRELMLDIIAQKLNITPWEIRMKNLVTKEDLPHTTCTGLHFDTLPIQECMEKAAAKVEYEKLYLNKKPYRGIGISNMIEWSSCRWNPPVDADYSSSTIKVEVDGSVSVTTDACDAGQGHSTVLSQVCAEELGITLDKIRIVKHNTDVTPVGLGTWGSRTAVMAGTAIKLAADEVKRKLFRIAAHWLEAAENELEAKENKVYVKGSPSKSVAMADLAVAAHFNRKLLPPGMPAGPIVGIGHWDAPNQMIDENGQGNFSIAYCNSCHIAVVDVDPETGLVELVDYAIVEDVGRALNPLLVKGQLYGGFAQALGYALSEKMIYDQEGNLINPTFTDYRIPTAMDVPLLEKIEEIESFDPNIPGGQKGIGESAATNPAAAIANAIFDAIGVPIVELPLTPEKIWQTIKNKGL